MTAEAGGSPLLNINLRGEDHFTGTFSDPLGDDEAPDPGLPVAGIPPKPAPAQRKASHHSPATKASIAASKLETTKEFGGWDAQHTITELQVDVKRLQGVVEEKDSHIDVLQDALVTLKDEVQFLEQADVQAAAKEIAKKNRNLQVMWQRERTKNAKLRTEMGKLEGQLKKAETLPGRLPKKDRQSMDFNSRAGNSVEYVFPPDSTCSQDVKEWRDKYAALNEKLCQTLSSVQTQNEQIKRLQGCLQRELGDKSLGPADIQKILSEGGNWRGRSEENARLKTKVRSLTKKIHTLTGKDEYDHHDDQLNKTRRHLNRVSGKRREAHEKLQEEMSTLKKNLKGMKLKQDACSARNTTLENDVRSFRTKLKVFLEKSSNDDLLIDKLRSELKRARTSTKKNVAGQKRENALKDEMVQLQDSVADLENECEDKSGRIHRLQEQLEASKRINSDKIRGILNECLNAERNYKVEFMKVESEKQRELVEFYQGMCEDMKSKVKKKSNACLELESENRTLTAENGKLKDKTTSRRRSKTGSRTPSSIASCEEKFVPTEVHLQKLNKAKAQNQLIEATYVSALEAKDEELNNLRERLKQQSNIHDRAMMDLNGKFMGLRDRLEL